eukprot:836406-Pleurochrysis_carterae.AAC.1
MRGGKGRGVKRMWGCGITGGDVVAGGEGGEGDQTSPAEGDGAEARVKVETQSRFSRDSQDSVGTQSRYRQDTSDVPLESLEM